MFILDKPTSKPLLLLALAMAAIGLAYSFAWTGTLHFDDSPNLSELGAINNHLDALDFITSGDAGPLGRPVSLATFALQAEAWPEPRPFLIVNTFIHLLNALLVFGLALALAQIRNGTHRLNYWFAVTVAFFWGAAPFLASSSLMIVQRMATFSATFVFLGLLGYVAGRLWMQRNERAGLLLAISSIGLGTLIAAFTKENGALLPILALVCELTLIRTANARTPPMPKWASGAVLWFPTVVIIGYLGYRGFSAGGFGHRDFNLVERLMTQSRVVWDYVFNLLIPRSDSSTPYMDSFPVSRGLMAPATTVIAIFAVLGTVVAAFLARRRSPLLTFGVAFFVAAHLMESTTIPLEIYYAHRNYVAAFGLFFALLFPFFFSNMVKRYAHLFFPGLVGYAVLSLTVLGLTTSLWGQPDLARQIWFENNPDSIRARQAMINLSIEYGDETGALALVNEALEKEPDSELLNLQRLIFCADDPEFNKEMIRSAKASLRQDRPLHFTVAAQFVTLANIPPRDFCGGRLDQHLPELFDLAIKREQSYPNLTVRRTLFSARAQFHVWYEEHEKIREWLWKAFEVRHDIHFVRFIANSYITEERPDDAKKAITQAEAAVTGSNRRKALDRARLRRWIAWIESNSH